MLGAMEDAKINIATLHPYLLNKKETLSNVIIRFSCASYHSVEYKVNEIIKQIHAIAVQLLDIIMKVIVVLKHC